MSENVISVRNMYDLAINCYLTLFQGQSFLVEIVWHRYDPGLGAHSIFCPRANLFKFVLATIA
jgi:hypothetical protein